MKLFRKKSHERRTKGFSLIETLIYVSILTFVTLGIINTLLLMGKSWVAISASRNVTLSAESALEVLTREIRGALSIDQANSVLATTSTSSVLTLNTLNLAGAAESVRFSVDATSSVLKIQRGSGTTSPITLANASTTAFTLYRITTPQSEGVRLGLTIQSTVKNVTRSQNFTTTVMIRGSYSN